MFRMNGVLGEVNLWGRGAKQVKFMLRKSVIGQARLSGHRCVMCVVGGLYLGLA